MSFSASHSRYFDSMLVYLWHFGSTLLSLFPWYFPKDWCSQVLASGLNIQKRSTIVLLVWQISYKRRRIQIQIDLILAQFFIWYYVGWGYLRDWTERPTATWLFGTSPILSILLAQFYFSYYVGGGYLRDWSDRPFLYPSDIGRVFLLISCWWRIFERLVR